MNDNHRSSETTHATSINTALAQEIEDAIMIGTPKEIESLLTGVEEGALPVEIRSSLESLLYFRNHYADRSKMSELEKKKITLMDAAWTMELLNKVRGRIITSPTSQLA